MSHQWAQPGRTLVGAAAGALSSLAFTWLHDVIISNIWNTLPIMLAAGAASGAALAWSYGRLFPTPSIRGWLAYNGMYIALLFLLGVISLLVFEPMVSFAAVSTASEPPRELMQRAMPLSITFTICSITLICWTLGRNAVDYLSVGITCAVIVMLLGLNVAVLGLVELSRDAVPVIAEFFALVALLGIAFALFLLPLAWRHFRPSSRTPDTSAVSRME